MKNIATTLILLLTPFFVFSQNYGESNSGNGNGDIVFGSCVGGSWVTIYSDNSVRKIITR